jgi:Zn-dependent protease with chaperone function
MYLTPVNSSPSEDLFAPSPQFKKEAAKSVTAIIGFIVVYLLLFVLSLALVGFCFYGGLFILSARISFYTILFSLGIIGCGVMIFVFLVKFLFSESKADNSDSLEITREEQPVLFQTILALAEETGAPKPKKIFLSPDVNAAVFYNSSFWSMFFPVKKNLKIGLGLVNVLNVSELKAVIAHEFGHFSQRSMKVGSWVYQVNKIIYDMLFNNQDYVKSLSSFANVHGIVAICVQLTFKVVQGIQWVLHQMFKVVNSSYLSLSRQMEFHADLVAASVCGSNNITNALRRSEFADTCFAATMNVCNTVWKEQKVVTNFFTHHRSVVAHLSTLNQLSLVGGLPILKEDEESSGGNRVNVKDQWASHPTLQERKAYLDTYELSAPVDAAPAWTLFQNEDEWKEKLTKLVYRNVSESDIKGHIDEVQFEALLTKQLQSFSYPIVFKEFYNNREVNSFGPEAVVHEPFVLQPFENILTEETVLLPKKFQYLQQDIAVLQAIVKKEVVTSSFDFDGQKFRRNEAAAVLAQLEGEKEAMQKQLDALDQTVFRYFYAVSPLSEAEDLKAAYQRYFSLRSKSDESLEMMNRMMEVLGPVFHGETMSIETIQAMVKKLKDVHEPAFKRLLNDWLAIGAFNADVSVKAAAEKFTMTRYEYFAGNSFFDNELFELNQLVQDSWRCISHFVFSRFKAITETQAAILEREKREVMN